MAAIPFPSRSFAQMSFAAILFFNILLPVLVLGNDSPSLLATAPKQAAVAPVPAPAPKVLTLHEKVVASLRAAGHYGEMAGLLDSLPDTIIKTGTTLFAPDDSAFNGILTNSTSLLETTLSYHVASKVYNYQTLTSLPVNTKIATSVPDVVIVVTNVAKDAFTLDNAEVANPDLYSDGTIAVHGLNAVFNTAAYNKGVVAPEAAPAPTTPALTAPTPSVLSPPADIAPPATPDTTKPNDAAHAKRSILLTMLALSIPVIMATW